MSESNESQGDAPDKAVDPDDHTRSEADTSPTWGKPTLALIWGVILVAILVIANDRITLDYYVLAPGGARPVNPVIQLPPDREYPPKGSMLYTTVALIRAHPFDIVYSQFDSDDQIRKKKEVIGDSTPDEFLAANTLSMEESRNIAIAVAMRKAGYTVNQKGEGAEIKAITEDAPAKGQLSKGDVITGINGQGVTLGSDVTRMVRATAPGTDVSVQVKAADGSTRTVGFKTGVRPDSPGQSYLGVLVQTFKPSLDTPFPVNVDLGKVGGPSAGLAMTVALLDELTEGELTGGGQVAATGTMDLDGKVGEVGGVKQKVAAVRDDSKAKVFIVPRSEAQQAEQYAGSKLKIIGVDTLDEAVSAIVANGGQAPGVARPH